MTNTGDLRRRELAADWARLWLLDPDVTFLTLCRTLGIAPPCPDEMIGSLVAVPIVSSGERASVSARQIDPLQDALLEHFGIEVLVFTWPALSTRLLRVSAQLYNTSVDYDRLADTLKQLLAG